ncbi:DUF3854 domain-containing protein [Viridibacillus arvi]|uniref:DUF3854 domain-containing protein n=1 Tax=Viridibacillus arvi TaxID=263475 RepID=UPI003D2E2318
MGDLRATKLKGWYEYIRQTCPICNKTGGCMINEAGDTVVCIREESNIVFSNSFQSWVHKLNEKQNLSVKNSNNFSNKTREKLDSYMLNHFFRRLQEAAPLSDEHTQHMVSERKMSLEEIKVRAYGSFPKNPIKAASYVFDNFHQLEKIPYGVPGFYKGKGNQGWSIAGSNGILIPYRNEYNEVVGYQIRVDNPLNDVSINKERFPGLQARVKQQPNLVQILSDGEVLLERKVELGEVINVEHDGFKGEVKLVKGQRYFWLSSSNKNEGTGAGGPTPIHVAVPTKELKKWEQQVEDNKNSSEYTTLRKCKSVWISEGALKADIAIEHISKVYSEEQLKVLGDTMLAVPGVNSWRMVMPLLEKMEVEKVNIAFDMDSMYNEKVAFQLREMIKELKADNIHASLVMWNSDDGKGIDDLFSQLKYPNIKELF